VEIERVCRECGVMLAVCHILRYSPQAKKISALIQSGVIGEVVNIRHHEPVSLGYIIHSPCLRVCLCVCVCLCVSMRACVHAYVGVMCV